MFLLELSALFLDLFFNQARKISTMNISNIQRPAEELAAPQLPQDRPSRRPYASPGLVEFGTVAQLTHGQGSAGFDAVGTRVGRAVVIE